MLAGVFVFWLPVRVGESSEERVVSHGVEVGFVVDEVSEISVDFEGIC